MSDKSVVYDQFDKAFARVSAYIVLDKSGDCVAKVAFKFPADGAGRLYAYVHWLGNEMVRGQAGGYGYDKRSSAVADAAFRYISQERKAARAIGDESSYMRGKAGKKEFWHAIEKDGGEYWDTRLRNAGFNVIQAV
jgi:hypothetical protein